MDWMEKAAGAIGRGLMRIALALLALGVVIGVFVYLGNNQRQFNRVVDAGGYAGTSLLVSTLTWIGDKAGGGSTGQAATAGPETIWVENKAPARWPVRQAVAQWNRGLTTVQLRIGKCPADAECIKVSQTSLVRDAGQPLVLGVTSTLFGKRVKLNAAAVGHVPASYLAFSTCHELGHALGLEHRASRGSCMFPSAAGASTRPDRADYVAVNEKHGG